MNILDIRGLRAEVEGMPILKGIDISIKAGEIHAIMGPNGSGKSTLASVLAGREDYDVTGGEVQFNGKDLLDFEPEDRAKEGLFLAFQYPVEIPGVTISNFIKTAVNEHRKYNEIPTLTTAEYIKEIKANMALLEIESQFLGRALNVGFSGGEKKRNEILQMSMLGPKLSILDETDSGLDIDALKIVAGGVNKLRSEDNAFLVITHYQRLLDYIVPDFVHVLLDGRIVKSGDKTLALELEKRGYDWIKEGVGTSA